jgi:four helix bundle protein
MKRAVIAIPSNIAEGKRRRTQADFAYFLTIANGSCAELETQIDISTMLEFTDVESSWKAAGLLEEIMKMLNTMITNLHKPTA